MADKIWLVKRHKTPYTGLPAKVADVVRHRKMRYRKGSMYRMEGVRGYEYFEMGVTAEVTALQVFSQGKWQPLMIDDPLHWVGMQEMAKKANPGTVLVSGLGMGLILYPLMRRKDISKITVIEIDPAIIDFTQEYIPKDDRIEVETANIFSYIINCMESGQRYNTVLLDLWVIGDKSTKQERQSIVNSMGVARHLASAISDRVMLWGVRGY